MATFESIDRPQRWNVPFAADMTNAAVDRLLRIEPFCSLDESRFPDKFSLRGILKNDTRITRYQKGDIIVRQGDWGNTAFIVVSGTIQVCLGSLPGEVLGRHQVKRKGLFRLLAQLWRNSDEPEVRDVASYRKDPRLAARGTGQHTRISLQDTSAVLDQHGVTEIGTGQLFGESAALGRSPRQATAIANDECELLEIRWQGLRDLMRQDEGIRAHIDRVFRQRALRSFLHTTPIFEHLSDSQLSQLVEEATFETYGVYDWAGSFKRLAKQGVESQLQDEPLIAEEGDYANGVIIVRSGLARLSRRHEHGHRTVGYLTPGHVYGLNEIIEGWQGSAPRPLVNSLRAIGTASVIVVPTHLIESLLLDRSSSDVHSTSKSYPAGLPRQPELDAAEVNPDFVEFLVQNRFVNGTATMLIDLDRCTRCDDCVLACASAHDNNPRFLRRGPIQNNIMVANACMHCEDPVCMIECPTGAIHRDVAEGQVLVNDRTCIGCSACANNCPYNAIRMVEVRHRLGDFIRDKQSHAPIVKATKCDLCLDQLGGPACQNACPHDALVRMDISNLATLAKWSRR